MIFSWVRCVRVDGSIKVTVSGSFRIMSLHDLPRLLILHMRTSMCLSISAGFIQNQRKD